MREMARLTGRMNADWPQLAWKQHEGPEQGGDVLQKEATPPDAGSQGGRERQAWSTRTGDPRFKGGRILRLL